MGTALGVLREGPGKEEEEGGVQWDEVGVLWEVKGMQWEALARESSSPPPNAVLPDPVDLQLRDQPLLVEMSPAFQHEALPRLDQI